MNRTITRLSAVLFTTALIGLAGPAYAHVGVSSTDASQGGFGKAVFRVPNESDTASTTKLVITFPDDTPFAFVTAGAKPGWKVSIKKEKLDEPAKAGDFDVTEVVRTVTWTTTGDGIQPSQFDEFAISGGPFPEVASIAFSAEQTYDDGEIVSWDELQKGDTEPEHPAPTLTLVESTGDHHGAGSADTDDAKGAADESSNTTAFVAVALGAAALVVATSALVGTLRQNRRRA
ncbi:nuclear export factor GLE1 [Aeromicrobium sp. A1-2]|uniref:YcnI family copper-binding membrane protein n=1 Tax=Aeromicrobium sp. A1-2 TaxID=2107713 RepID=UPI000E46A8BD|nr:YcnI family protein [Aeromicrobium sp. A1-2]AXT84996.1 nuclear export factor GLE1 [Aeromicrobium sp. A1-2]